MSEPIAKVQITAECTLKNKIGYLHCRIGKSFDKGMIYLIQVDNQMYQFGIGDFTYYYDEEKS